MDTISKVLKTKDSLVYGNETGNEAKTRYIEAVKNIVQNETEGNIAIVSHGTVMSLLVEEYNHVNIVELWKELKSVSCVVLDQNFKLLENFHV